METHDSNANYIITRGKEHRIVPARNSGLRLWLAGSSLGRCPIMPCGTLATNCFDSIVASPGDGVSDFGVVYELILAVANLFVS